MIESKEKESIAFYEKANFYGNWLPPKTGNIYENILNSYFYEGRKYAGDNLIFKASTFKDAEYIINNDTFKASLGFIGEHDPIDKNYKIIIKFNTYSTGNYLDYRTSEDVLISIILDENNSPEVVSILDGFSYTWDSSSKIITCNFVITTESIKSALLVYSDFIHDTGDVVTFEQYEVITEGSTLNGAIDCSTFVSFLWAAKKEKIIKNKLFTCSNLIDESFQYLEFTKKFAVNGFFIDYSDLHAVLNETEPGDILIFVEGNTKHCIFLIDPKNKKYAECSSFVSYNLGEYYNCKENPYNMENRITDLLKNSTAYLCRLL